MKPFIIALAAISSVLLFAGCGQSGPLYLPGDPSKLETQPPAPAEGEEEKEENQEDSDAPTG
jgi:predicted small lipoprotein YifL